MTKQTQFNSCTQMRRKLVTHGTFSMATGETAEGAKEWRTEPCGSPLFGNEERKTGLCRSCASGWTHENNYAVTA